MKTFAPIKVTVQKQNKEIKDNKTVISCLRKKIAFSKSTNKPIQDLDQFLQLPRALCNADGIPEKGVKSHASSFFRISYPDAFSVHLPLDTNNPYTCYIIDGMFIINTVPLTTNNTFAGG